jgi:hypothetical protein
MGIYRNNGNIPRFNIDTILYLADDLSTLLKTSIKRECKNTVFNSNNKAAIV